MRTLFTASIKLAVLAALLLLAGCASLITGGPLITDPNLPTGQLIINNQSGVTLTGIAISNCRASSYGMNRLNRGEVVPHGRQRSFTVTVGCWDVYLHGADNSNRRQRMEVGANGMRYTLEPAENNN